MKVEEYLSAYDNLLSKIDSLIEEDNYVDIMGLISEIDHLIALIDAEVKKLGQKEKAKLKPKAEEIVRKQELILSKIDKRMHGLQEDIRMMPKLQKAAEVYGKNEKI